MARTCARLRRTLRFSARRGEPSPAQRRQILRAPVHAEPQRRIRPRPPQRPHRRAQNPPHDALHPHGRRRRHNLRPHRKRQQRTGRTPSRRASRARGEEEILELSTVLDSAMSIICCSRRVVLQKIYSKYSSNATL